MSAALSHPVFLVAAGMLLGAFLTILAMALCRVSAGQNAERAFHALTVARPIVHYVATKPGRSITSAAAVRKADALIALNLIDQATAQEYPCEVPA